MSQPHTEHEKPILYAVVINIVAKNRRGQQRWIPGGIEYVHASSAVEAKAKVIRGSERRIDIVEAAPAVGYFVDDEKKVKLSVS